MNVSGTGGRSAGKTDWDRLDRMTDQEIETAVADDPDSPPLLSETFWRNSVVVRPQKKIPITVRLDADVVKWFRSHGKGYQTHINAVLRSYVQTHKK